MVPAMGAGMGARQSRVVEGKPYQSGDMSAWLARQVKLLTSGADRVRAVSKARRRGGGRRAKLPPPGTSPQVLHPPCHPPA